VAHSDVAKLFANGRSQAVRLPQEYRFEGDQVRVRRMGSGVLLEPILNPKAWFIQLDQFKEAFMPDGRNQPATPVGSSFE